MLYGGNRDLAQTADAKICAAHRCELSIEEHDLSDKYPNLCKKHARIAHREEEDNIEVEEQEEQPAPKNMHPCACCKTQIEKKQGGLCPNCEKERLTKKWAAIVAMANYAKERAIAQTMPRCGANLPAFVAQLQKVFHARDCAEKARHEYAIRYTFINL